MMRLGFAFIASLTFAFGVCAQEPLPESKNGGGF